MPHLLVERGDGFLVATINRPEAMTFDMQVGLPIFATTDTKEGPRTFAEKRKPAFTRT